MSRRPTKKQIDANLAFYQFGDAHPATDRDLLPEFRERTAQAIERTYRSLAAGTLRHKSISAERLALIFTAIAEDLLKGRLEAGTPLSDDDLPHDCL